MWSHTRKIFYAVFYISMIHVCQPDAANNFPLWSWECVNEKCVPSRATQTGKLHSLETCNMLCASLQLWPLPTGPVNLATAAVPVRSDMFQLETVTAPSRIVRQYQRDAFQLLQKDLRQMEGGVRGFEEYRTVAVRIFVNNSGDPRMRLDTDESYELTLRPENNSVLLLTANVKAHSFCGARHALETLLQLVWLDSYAGSLLVVESAKVQDAPRFRYRGILIDTARGYFPLSELMRTIEAMAASKLNTFHWHVSDSQGFSLRLNSVPQLARYGAYGSGEVYSPDEVKALVRRATLRGVRVLIEVDTPAHVGYGWSLGPAAGIGDLIHCLELKPWTAYCNEPPCGQLNPHNPHVYELLQRIYAEIIQLTGVDDLFHLGGDAVSKRCWARHYNQTDPAELWIKFTRLALQRLERANGKKANLTLFWTSHLREKVKTDLREFAHIIGMQTRSVAWTHKYVSGLRTVVSHEDAWDLNSGTGAWHEESGGAPYNSWQRVYEHRPWLRGGAGLVEGGEATVWSTSVSEGELDGRIWPRAAALAERLWTDQAEGATRPVHVRLDVHRSRLVARGVRAAPMWSMWCTQNTYACS